MIDVDLSLPVSLHGKSVKDALGWLFNAEDHNLVDELRGGSGIQVLVAD